MKDTNDHIISSCRTISIRTYYYDDKEGAISVFTSPFLKTILIPPLARISDFDARTATATVHAWKEACTESRRTCPFKPHSCGHTMDTLIHTLAILCHTEFCLLVYSNYICITISMLRIRVRNFHAKIL